MATIKSQLKVGTALLAGMLAATSANATDVTLFGIINTGFGVQERKGVDLDGVRFKEKKVGAIDQGWYGNQWGIRGSEDVSGQTRAEFHLESGFSMTTGEHYQGDRLFGRQATLSLVNDQWGRLDLGRQTNMTFKVLGNVASPFGGNGWQFGVGATLPAANVVRYDNMVLYQTPKWGGFSGGIGYSFNTDGEQLAKTSPGVTVDNADISTAEANVKAITAGINYSSGPVQVGLAYEQNDWGKLRRAGNGFIAGDKGKVRSWNLGASYQFDSFKLHGGVGQSRNGIISVPSLVDQQYGIGYTKGLKFNSYLVGVTVPITPNDNLFASAGFVDPRSVPKGGQKATQKSYNLGWMHDLSKRTSIYVLAGYARNVGFFDDMKSSMYTAGLAHKF